MKDKLSILCYVVFLKIFCFKRKYFPYLNNVEILKNSEILASQDLTNYLVIPCTDECIKTLKDKSFFFSLGYSLDSSNRHFNGKETSENYCKAICYHSNIPYSEFKDKMKENLRIDLRIG